MKKYVLMTAAIFALAAPSAAWSQTASPGGGNGPVMTGPSGGNAGGGQGQERFAEHKAMVLQHMNEHLAEIQKRISCVQAATDHEQLHACLPQGMGMGGGMNGGMQQGGSNNNAGRGGPGSSQGSPVNNGGPSDSNPM